MGSRHREGVVPPHTGGEESRAGRKQTHRPWPSGPPQQRHMPPQPAVTPQDPLKTAYTGALGHQTVPG